MAVPSAWAVEGVARSSFKDVDEYIASFPKDVQTILETVRRTIRAAVPKATESISYQIPAYKTQGRVLIYFAAFKNHYSLYPIHTRILKAFKTKLAPYETSGRGTLRLPLDEPVPVQLIRDVVRHMAKENLGRERTT